MVKLLYLQYRYPKSCVVFMGNNLLFEWHWPMMYGVPKDDRNSVGAREEKSYPYLDIIGNYSDDISDYELRIAPSTMEQIQQCMARETPPNMIAIPLVMTTGKNETHANMVIYSPHTQELERFEPHSDKSPLPDQGADLDARLKKQFSEIIPIRMSEGVLTKVFA